MGSYDITIILLLLLVLILFLFFTGRGREGYEGPWTDTSGMGCYSDDHCSTGQKCCGGSIDGLSGLGTCCAGQCICSGSAEDIECTCVPIDL